MEHLRKDATNLQSCSMPTNLLNGIKKGISAIEGQTAGLFREKDELTGLLSSSCFFEYASTLDKIYPERKMDAVTVNINHFHLYNELYGMNEGDQVLKLIGGCIREFSEEMGGIAGRSDADNFSIYVPHQDSYECLASFILESIQSDKSVHNTGIRLGVNDAIDEEDSRLEMAFDRARMAGDTADKDSKKIICYYDSALRKQRIFEERLIRDLSEGIANHQFKVLYQPKYDVTEDLPILKGAEALVRWEHPELGTIHPGCFVPLFEENGLISLLDEFVWRQAAAQVKEWKDKFGVSVPVSVNVSRIDIKDNNIVTNLCDIVKEVGIDVSDLHLEITESAYVSDTKHLVETVEAFREKGFVIEMDDFGSGYSSLNMLTTLPIDILKVDMRFMENIKENQKGVRMMELVKEIADFLSGPIVAEGVEQQEQLDALKRLGCQMIQGYYFSKPIPVGEFEMLLAS